MATQSGIWWFGDITEDKKLTVRFLDADGNPILLSALYGYGVKIFSNSGVILKCGVNIEEYTNDNLVIADEYTIKVAMDGEILPHTKAAIYAATTIIIEDPEMPDGYFTDHSEGYSLIYNAMERK